MGFGWEILLMGLVAGVQCFTDTSDFVFKHHSNEDIPKILEKIHLLCPNITRVYSLSEPSVLGEPLYLIEFSENPGHHALRKRFPDSRFFFLCLKRCVN